MNLDKYLGIPYDNLDMDCGALVMLVQKELFGREIFVPNGVRKSVKSRLEFIRESQGVLAEATQTPEDGDVILMRDMSRAHAWHLGVFFRVDYVPHVLHTTEVLGSRLDVITELAQTGIAVEGYYKWL